MHNYNVDYIDFFDPWGALHVSRTSRRLIIALRHNHGNDRQWNTGAVYVPVITEYNFAMRIRRKLTDIGVCIIP